MSVRRDDETQSLGARPAAAAAPTPTPASNGTSAWAAEGWTLLAIAAVRWLRVQRPRLWWRVLVGGAALLGLAWLAIVPDKLTGLVPLYTLAFGALVPVVVAIAWWERIGARLPFIWDLPLALTCGLVAGVISALVLYSGWIELNVATWQGALGLAAIEELLKTLAVVYLLWSPRLRSVREGMRVGLAAALGFMLAQMALASYLAYHATVTLRPHAEEALFRAGIASMDHMLAFQLALQVLGEVIWTVTICAALWRERGEQRVRVTSGLVVVVVAVLVLHGAFNYVYANQWLDLRLGGAFLPLVNLLVAVVSFGLLRFFLVETHEREALGSLPETPLLPALGTYLADQRRRFVRWYGGVQAASAVARPKRRPNGAPPGPRPDNPGRGTPRPPQPMEPPDASGPTDPPGPRTPPSTEWLR